MLLGKPVARNNKKAPKPFKSNCALYMPLNFSVKAKQSEEEGSTFL
jgi:hypothetical protein